MNLPYLLFQLLQNLWYPQHLVPELCHWHHFGFSGNLQTALFCAHREGITLHRPLLMELITCQFVPRIFDFRLYKVPVCLTGFFNQKLFRIFSYSRHFSSPLCSAPSPFLRISYCVCEEWRTREKGEVTLHNTTTAGFCEV